MTSMYDIGCWYTDRTSTVRKDMLKELSWASDNLRLAKNTVEPVQLIVVGKHGCKVMKDILQSKALRDELIAWLEFEEIHGDR